MYSRLINMHKTKLRLQDYPFFIFKYFKENFSMKNKQLLCFANIVPKIMKQTPFNQKEHYWTSGCILLCAKQNCFCTIVQSEKSERRWFIKRFFESGLHQRSSSSSLCKTARNFLRCIKQKYPVYLIAIKPEPIRF